MYSHGRSSLTTSPNRACCTARTSSGVPRSSIQVKFSWATVNGRERPASARADADQLQIGGDQVWRARRAGDPPVGTRDPAQDVGVHDRLLRGSLVHELAPARRPHRWERVEMRLDRHSVEVVVPAVELHVRSARTAPSWPRAPRRFGRRARTCARRTLRTRGRTSRCRCRRCSDGPRGSGAWRSPSPALPAAASAG